VLKYRDILELWTSKFRPKSPSLYMASSRVGNTPVNRKLWAPLCADSISDSTFVRTWSRVAASLTMGSESPRMKSSPYCGKEPLNSTGPVHEPAVVLAVVKTRPP
jgi:hypothetical protein